jgi:hypothetical protein
MKTFESFLFGSDRDRRRADEFFESLEPEAQIDPPDPSGVVLVEHFHWSSRCEGNRWVEASTPSKVRPSQLDPGFLDAVGGLVFDSRLDNSLIDLMVSEHAAFLTAESVRRRWPQRGDLVHVCIVDMSKGSLCRPRYAGWGSEHLVGAASSAKVALLYAAHQLIADLNVLATRSGTRDVSALDRQAKSHWGTLPTKPDVPKLAVFDGAVVRPSTHLRTTVEEMIDAQHSNVSTGKANVVLQDIGFDYVASLLWQSGLRHPTAKGLWFPNDFGRARSWPRDPFREGKIGLTARSMATFLTLLAQGRLINAGNSSKMEGILRKGCRFAAPSGVTVRAAKCGLTDDLRHDAMLLSAPGDLLYAVVCLTEGKAKQADDELGKLTSGIHRLIVRRNP